MARYIDADKFVENIQENICRKCDIHNGIKCKSCEIDDMLDFLEDAPTADVVEVEKYNELREDFIAFACSGVNNLAPYCKNRCVECVDERGWCKYGDSCKGFNPDGERRS